MQIQWVSIKDLVKAEYNPRILTEKEESDLKQSMERFGFVDPMIVNSNPNRKNTIIAGHQRMKVWQKLGNETAPVIYIDLSPEMERELNIRHNRNTGEWDHTILKSFFQESDLLSWGFNKEDLKFDLQKPADPFEDDYVIPDKIETDIVLGDVFCIGDHRLLCGNATEISSYEKLFEDNRARMLITDPPYNVDYVGKTKDKLKIQNDKMNNDQFYDFLYDFYTNILLYCDLGSAWYIWHADSEGENFRSAMRNCGVKVRECLIWAKNSMVMGRQDYQWKHEPCLYGWTEGAAHRWYSDRKQTTVLEFNRPNKSEDHPTMKPIELFGYLIKNSSIDNEIVADLFAGSGTTLIACHQMGRRAYLMELDPKYCQVILNRIVKLDPAITILRNGEPYRPE